MHESAVIGGLLFHTSDPVFAARILESFLASSVDCENELRACGIDPAMAAALRIVLPKDKASIHVACAQGAAWVLGFRSAPQADSWQLVATVPVGMALPAGVRRATAETIISIVTSAQKAIRIAAPYVDIAGLELLSDGIAAATLRGVSVELFETRNWGPGIEAARLLQEVVSAQRDVCQLRVSHVVPEIALAHLKVVTADGRTAYVGSANITGAGLRGRNAELGVLLQGPDVLLIDELLDLYRQK